MNSIESLINHGLKELERQEEIVITKKILNQYVEKQITSSQMMMQYYNGSSESDWLCNMRYAMKFIDPNNVTIDIAVQTIRTSSFIMETNKHLLPHHSIYHSIVYLMMKYVHWHLSSINGKKLKNQTLLC